jgi:hypothetical protein
MNHAAKVYPCLCYVILGSATNRFNYQERADVHGNTPNDKESYVIQITCSSSFVLPVCAINAGYHREAGQSRLLLADQRKKQAAAGCDQCRLDQ